MAGRNVLRALVVTGVLLVIALMGAACGAAEEPTKAPTVVASPTPVPPTATPAPPQPKYGGIAIFSQRGDPPGWDPMVSAADLGEPTMMTNGAGGLTIACRKSQTQICPHLAESWESNSDFTQWTFKIRDGVLWQDGTPFTAEDAKWWLELAVKGVPPERAPARYAATLGDVKTVEVLSGNRMRVTLNRPMGAYPSVFSDPGNTHIAHPRHLMQPAIEKGNPKVAPNEVGWVGIGPYKVLKYEKAVIIQLRKFDRYWEKDAQGRQLPFVDGIDLVIQTDASAMVAAFRAGRLDRTSPYSGRYIAPEQKPILEREMGDKMYIVDYPGYGTTAGWNTRRAPLNDVRVRQAISMWLDRQSLIDYLSGGFGVPVAVWQPGSSLANPDVLQWPGWNTKTKAQDREKAKQILKDAGYPSGFKLSILTGERWVNRGEWLKGQLDGLLGEANVKIDVFDTATFLAKTCSGDFQIVNPLDSGVWARHSPELLAGGYSSTNKCSYIQHDDKKVDDLFARITASGNLDERAKLAREVERYLSIEAWLALNLTKDSGYFVAFRSYMKGWDFPQVIAPFNADYATIWMDK
ncbi:MAG: ABC transporter substrate-binding protein [Chloroflexi bacterium]|nr:ABC transporter substrate-binding protein [Chloroflexota bacterium]